MSYRKDRGPLPYSPSSNNYYNTKTSPTKASMLLQEDHAEYISSLHARKDNFCTCLDLYGVSYENELPQKCLVHNNFITLYCENEFKLLCVNCIYSSAVHKDHRVVPSKNSIANIARDNQDNLRILQEELERIKYADVQMKKNKKVLEDEFRLIMQQIEEEFREMYAMLQQKQNRVKQQVMEAFTKASRINDEGISEISWWRELLIKTKATFPKPSLHEDTEIFKHLVLDLFMQEKIDEQKLTYLPSGQEIRSDFIRQVIDLKEAIEQYVGSGKERMRQRNY